MSLIQGFLLTVTLVSGIALALLIIFSESEDQGLISTSQKSFMPGTFDATRNKIIAIFSIIFVASILLINTFEVRSKNFSFKDVADQTTETSKNSKNHDKTPTDYD